MEGILSNLFLVSLVFSLIVIRDAIGVRRTVDDLISYVNKIIKRRRLGLKDITKITGHNPIQVFIGILIGGVIAVFVNYAPLI